MRGCALRAAADSSMVVACHQNRLSILPGTRPLACRQPQLIKTCTPQLVKTCIPASAGRAPRTLVCRAVDPVTPTPLVGEDAASFDVEKQSLTSWAYFFGLLTGVLGLLYLVWIQPGTGLADDYLQVLEGFSSNNPEATILLILFVFALFHSGLAGFRPTGEKIIGARAYRVLFALGSLPLAVVAIVYFINHRYDGTPLWNIQAVSGVHEMVWIMNFISFYFLYPSTFNILEVAAVDEPKLHLWETGIMRITRHPQMVGQGIWCLGHTLWVGNSFMVATSLGLMAHHLFGCWHGDRRLNDKYGEAFQEVKARTSTMPFQAIWEGRQQLPADYYKEFLRVPYAAVTVFTLGAYYAHPIMQSASYYLHW